MCFKNQFYQLYSIDTCLSKQSSPMHQSTEETCMGRVPAGLKSAFRHQFPPSPGNFSVILFREVFMAVCATRGALRGRSGLREEKSKRMEVTTSSWSWPHPGGAGGIKAVCPSSVAPGCVLCAEVAVDVIPRTRRASSVTKPGSFISYCRPSRFRGRRSESFSS